MKLILLGYMGSGKSTIGKVLSEKLIIPFIDLDNYIESLEGKTIARIFKDHGELYFRKKERACVEELIKRDDNFVLALGGGTPCYYDTMDFLNGCENVNTIYIKSNLEDLGNRLFKEKSKRPLIASIESKEDLKEFIAKHIFERSFYYSKAKSIVNNTSIERAIVQIEDVLK